MKKKKSKQKLRTIPGRILGSIVCSVMFSLSGFFMGILYPWVDINE